MSKRMPLLVQVVLAMNETDEVVSRLIAVWVWKREDCGETASHEGPDDGKMRKAQHRDPLTSGWVGEHDRILGTLYFGHRLAASTKVGMGSFVANLHRSSSTG